MRKNGEKGFLLVELLVSLAVLAVLTAPLLTLAVLGARVQAQARRHTAAVYLARETLESVRSRGYCSAEEFTACLRRGGVDYLCDVAVTAPAAWGGCEVKEVRVTVSWEESAAAGKISLVTYLSGR